ncbi:hypothetical protein AM232_10195 [Bacillus sp. FJAT-21352]|nr:hypothetical protein AM232_10195 [Bacillus sp. FJAT-21352]
MKDGSIVNADKLNYGENDVFDYASVISYEGKIAQMQIDTESSIENIEKGLGVSFENYTVEPNKFGSGYEVIFNDTFADNNLAVLPNEWE